MPADPERLREEIAAHSWYHTIELAPGIETPGWFDLHSVAPRVLPPDLSGRRCLDVAAFDGFWSLEMQARGARETVAIDLLDPARWDWPARSAPEAIHAIGERKSDGDGFATVMRARGTAVERRDLSVYDLDPGTIGTFDFVYVGSVLIHLRDPIGALERIRAVCTGDLVLVDSFDPLLTRLHPRLPVASLDGEGRPWWWRANVAGLVRMVESAGFEVLGAAEKVTMRPGAGQRPPRLTPRTVASRAVRTAYRQARWGDPHAVIRARPRPPVAP